MKQRYVDFHTHTKHSDGQHSLEELIGQAVRKNIRIMAVTDHDTVDTFTSANIAALKNAFPDLRDHGDTLTTSSLRIVKGIEFTATHKDEDIHILGLYIEKVPDFIVKEYFHEVCNRRNKRAAKIVELNGKNFDIDFDLVRKEAGITSAYTKLHIGYAIFKKEHPRYKSAQSVVDRFFKKGDKGYVSVTDGAAKKDDKLLWSAEKTIRTIIQLGGIPVWAHPAREHLPIEDTLSEFQEYARGCMFTETSKNYSHEKNRECAEIALRVGVPVLDSSDFHGEHMKHNNTLGCRISDAEYSATRKLLRKTLTKIRDVPYSKLQD